MPIVTHVGDTEAEKLDAQADALVAESRKAEADIDRIKDQIERATNTLRSRGRKVKHLQEDAGALRRRARSMYEKGRQRSAGLFVFHAKQLLGAEQFEEIERAVAQHLAESERTD